MKTTENLEKQFKKAGLVCKVLKEPIRKINADIFQADIQRGFSGNKRKEYFRIYKGHKDNLVTVANIAKEINQLVLVVKEPQRLFEERIVLSREEVNSLSPQPKSEWLKLVERAHQGHGLKDKVLRLEERKNKLHAYYYERKTPRSVRHYLLGVDERQLFIATLPKAVTTVMEAHRTLKSSAVTFAEGKAEGKTLRQGEWFFVEATEKEKKLIEQAIKTNRVLVQKKSDIGRITGARSGGKAHIAKEAVILEKGPPLSHGYTLLRRPEVFVRGSVSHPDHATIQLKQWRRVIKNAEVENDSNRSVSGVFWID